MPFREVKKGDKPKIVDKSKPSTHDLDPPEQWRGHPWSDVQHSHPDIIFIMLKRNQQIFNQLPDGFFFQGGDKLVVGGDTQALRRLAKAIRQTAI